MTEDYSPWTHIAGMPDVLVAYDELEHADAYWEPARRVILLDVRLGQAQRRSRLAHELAHLERGDECCADGPDAERLGRRQEREADQLAARRLLSLSDLADALCWCVDEWELAEDLWVDQATIRTRLDSLTRWEQDYIERRIAANEGAA